MTKEYMKPTVRVVELQHKNCLLAGSPTGSTSSNLATEDAITIDDTPVGNGFWGR